MATCEEELKVILSEDLPARKVEKQELYCENKDEVSEDKATVETCSSPGNLNRNNDSECNDKNTDMKTAIENTAEESADCVVEGNDFNRPSEFGGRKLDEVLLEEDEGHLEDSDEHYESAEEDIAPEENLTHEQAEERMTKALELKKEGNDHFRNQEYVKGKDLYTEAIKLCPRKFTENKSIFYANRAACFQKLEEFETAISDCGEALELAPNYLKARLRRAQCYEKVDKLEEALEDYKIVFESDKSCQSAREAIMRLPEEIKIKHEKLKEEMIGKLKDLGNMVLRPFGLSTDNFKLQQDPNSGGQKIQQFTSTSQSGCQIFYSWIIK